MAFVKFWADVSTNFDASKAQSDTLYFLTDTGKLYKGNTLIADKTPDSLPNANGFNLYANGGTTPLHTYDGSSTVNLKAGSFVQFTESPDGTITISSADNNTTYTLSGAASGNTWVTTLTPSSGSPTTSTVPAMTGATSSKNGAAGLVPPATSANRNKFLRGDGTWETPTNTTYSDMTGATSSAAGAHGLVPAPAAGKQASFLRGDGTWAVPTDTNTHYATGITTGAANATANATTEVTDPYINIKDDSTHRGGVQLKGSGATSVKAVNGAITISSTNTWNANTGTQAGFVASPGNAKNKVWGTGSSGTPAWVDFSAAALGLGNAVHFLGTSSTEITDGGTQTPTIGSATVTPKAGDVVLYGNQEFIYNASNKWELFGDEGSYAIKTRKIEAGTGLTGGGDLTADRTFAVKVGSTNKLGAAGAAGTTTNTTKVYAVQEDKDGNLAVYVPWTDTNTKVSHTARSSSTTSYILGTSTAPTSGNVAVTALSETSVYIQTDNSTSTIVAPRFKGALVGNVTGNVSGSSGSCTGNAATATKATKDGGGNVIVDTYATKTTVTGVQTNVTNLQTTLTWQSGAM